MVELTKSAQNTEVVDRTDEVNSKYCFEVVDKTDEVSSKHVGCSRTDEVSSKHRGCG
ncbi:hypothetical protein PNI0159_01741 [Streptococcus pneumoniae PNI0159]|nr:hypothetical protein PNI0159_01741 [Streptococcus pneumoniae PNI0159]